MLTNLRILKQTIDKQRNAFKENFPLADYLQTPRITTMESLPFPHIIADNFFSETIHGKKETEVRLESINPVKNHPWS